MQTLKSAFTASIEEAMTVRKIFALIISVCMVFALAGCGEAKDREITNPALESPTIITGSGEQTPATDEETPVVEVKLPTATSEEVELYIGVDDDGKSCVMNAFGDRAKEYSVDKEGNILNADGAYVIMAENASNFKQIKRLNFDKHEYSATLTAQEETVEDDPNVTRITQHPVHVLVTLNFAPAELTNGAIILSVGDTSVAEFRANANSQILADGEYALREGQIVICPDADKDYVTITVTAKSAGDTKIMAEAVVGDAYAECVLKVTEGTISTELPTEVPSDRINASGDAKQHTHVYSQTEVPPTIWERGYTIFTCGVCGHSYMDNFTSKLPAEPETDEDHVHDYISSVVAPTADERGYTLHTCIICGESYKDCYVNPTGR